MLGMLGIRWEGLLFLVLSLVLFLILFIILFIISFIGQFILHPLHKPSVV